MQSSDELRNCIASAFCLGFMYEACAMAMTWTAWAIDRQTDDDGVKNDSYDRYDSLEQYTPISLL
jgi:hypothetical protein